ncbi:MAG: DinB family protein [Ginsengibacter sp.]
MSNNVSSISITKKRLGDIPVNMEAYFAEAGNADLKTLFAKQLTEAKQLFKSIDEEKSMHSYAEGKWTLREVLQHLIDAERVFAYRALAFARQDKTVLPSFDENDYANNSNANGRSWSDLAEEFVSLRQSTEYMYNSFATAAFDTIGKASNYTIGVSTLGFVIVGHVNHHFTIIKERYLA